MLHIPYGNRDLMIGSRKTKIPSGIRSFKVKVLACIVDLRCVPYHLFSIPDTVKIKPPFWVMLYLFWVLNQNGGGTYFILVIFRGKPISSHISFERFRRELSIDVAEHWSMLKNYQNTHYPRFSFIPKTSRVFPKTGVLFVLCIICKHQSFPLKALTVFGRDVRSIRRGYTGAELQRSELKGN